MTDLKKRAAEIIEKLFCEGQPMEKRDYDTICSALHELETLRERDAALENLWAGLEDIPMNPETECLEAPFLDFPVGTQMEDILRWFGARHSKGIAYLLYDDADALDNEALWKALEQHEGHSVHIVKYGDPDDPADVCLECDDCGVVILDAELYTLQARENVEG